MYALPDSPVYYDVKARRWSKAYCQGSSAFQQLTLVFAKWQSSYGILENRLGFACHVINYRTCAGGRRLWPAIILNALAPYERKYYSIFGKTNATLATREYVHAHHQCQFSGGSEELILADK